MFDLTIYSKVAKGSAAFFREAVDEFRRIVDCREHTVRIIVVPAKTVTDGKGGYGFGAFWVNDGEPMIAIAGQWAWMRQEGASQAAIRYHMAETLAHELAHFEQWRDGREQTEEEAEKRESQLVKRAMPDVFIAALVESAGC